MTVLDFQPVAGVRTLQPRKARWPWMTSFIILIGLLLAVHDLNASREWQENAQNDVKTLVQNEATGRVARQVGILILGAVGFYLLVKPTDHPWRINPLVLFPFVMLVIWAVISPAWAPEPDISFKRVIALGCGLLLTVGMVRQFEMVVLAEIALLHTLVITLIGIVVELWLGPPPGKQLEYRFAGTVHPNHAGAYVAMMLLCCLYLGKITGNRWLIPLAIFAIVMLFLTKSRTALAAVIVASVVFIAMAWQPKKKMTLFLILFVVILAVAAADMLGAFSNLEQTVLLDRHNADPTTLTGRTVIWAFAFEHVRNDWGRLMTGFGYGGFWTEGMVAALSTRAHFKLAEGHNAFLDMMLQTGLVGLFLYLWGFLGAWISFISQGRKSKSADAAFGAAILAFAFTHHFAESGLLEVTYPSLMVWTTMAIAAFRAPVAPLRRWIR